MDGEVGTKGLGTRKVIGKRCGEVEVVTGSTDF